MLIFNLLTVHNGDTRVCVATAGSLWYTKDHLCLNQRWPFLCPSGILETRVVLYSPFRNKPPYVSSGVKEYTWATGTSSLAALPLCSNNRCETIWGSFTPLSGPCLHLYSQHRQRWGLCCANPPPDHLLGSLSLCQEAALMGWVHSPLLPPPREAFFLLQLWTHFRCRVVLQTGEYCSGNWRQMQSCFQRKACQWKREGLS